MKKSAKGLVAVADVHSSMPWLQQKQHGDHVALPVFKGKPKALKKQS